MRCIIYARFSTDKQDELSIEVQLDECRREVARRGWTEVAVFTDSAQSGATMHRPGMQDMLKRLDTADVVFADAMDRLSRSQADIATLYERLKFRGMMLITRKEGNVTPMHIGMTGTMNAEQISATSGKTRDALRKRHAMGRNPGGIAYGYEKVIEHDANGDRIKGLVRIVPAQAQHVTRILEDYAKCVSPYIIARRLNEEGVPPPRSGKRDKKPSGKAPAWTPNTITGNIERGTGILNNMRYIGLVPFEKQTYRKNPDTGKRHAFVNHEDEQAELVAVPELRIVSDELWAAVKARQATLRRGDATTEKAAGAPLLPFFAQQRPKYLLTGKMTCGTCGASYAKSGKSRFGC